MSQQVWFVTGSSRGLGRQIVEAALAAGHLVAATARRREDIADLAVAHPDQVHLITLDVTDRDAADSAIAQTVERFGRLDVLVNNAGYANFGSIEDTTDGDFRAQLETNLFGVVNVTKAALPLLHRQGDGHVITVSSVGGRVATPGLGAYQAAKWAVNGFTEVLAQEVAPLGIKVTTIEPGGMRTDWAGSSMTLLPVSAGYEPTVGAIAAMLRSGDAGSGDTAKVADVVLQLAAMDHPPTRLLLGSDAETVAQAAASTLRDRDVQWQQLTRSTDRDDATAQHRDPLSEAAR